jgi:acyl-CoA thioesterase FadM
MVMAKPEAHTVVPEALGRTSIRFAHHMHDSETGEEVAASELLGVYFDTEHRVAVPLPPAVRRRASELEIGRGDLLVPGNTTEEMVVLR